MKKQTVTITITSGLSDTDTTIDYEFNPALDPNRDGIESCGAVIAAMRLMESTKNELTEEEIER